VLDEEEYLRWVRSAESTLRSARGDWERGDYNWACFKAQQAAEFAVKGLLHGLGLPAYGHSVSKLLERLPESLGANCLIGEAKVLDRCYVPTRYPNAWAEGTPADYYMREDAENAIKYAERIIRWVDEKWRSLRKEGGLEKK